MKNRYLKTIFALLFFFVSGISNAQISTTGTTSNTSCDGSATLNNTMGFTSWTWISANNTAMQVNGLVLDSLCAGTYSINLSNALDDTTFTFVISSNNNPCLNFGGSISAQAADSPANCTGVLSVVYSGGTPPYAFTWTGGGVTYNTQTISNLCPNSTYTVNVVDANGCQLTYTGTVSDSSAIAADTLYMYAFPTPVSENGVCDGSVTFQTNVAQPFQISLSNGATSSTTSFTNMCQGYYMATVYGANGDTSFVHFIVPNPSNTFNNNSYPDSTVVDSLVSDLQENCQLNYANIISVYVSSYTYDSTSIEVVWVIVEGNTTSTQIVSYPYNGQNGVYSLGLNVYCPGKSQGNYFYATDRIAISDVLGLENNFYSNALFYPIPMQHELNIELPELGDYELIVLDLSGRTVLQNRFEQTKFIQLPVASLAKGTYSLLLHHEKGMIVRTLVK